MKAIWTTSRNGVARASDKDGNRAQLSTFDLSYEEGHREVARQLCERMGWAGILIGSYVLVAGQTRGMVWVWDDERNPRIVVKGR